MPSDSKSVEVSKWRLPTYSHKKMERPEKTDQMYTVKWPPFHVSGNSSLIKKKKTKKL